MGKKAKNDDPNPNRIANREVMQRLNYLYQASFYLNSIAAQSEEKEQNGPQASSDSYLERVSRSYIRSMKLIANKKVVKM
jgi:ribonuclease P protein subunit RPR2